MSEARACIDRNQLLTAAMIPDDDFARMRRANLARWPTGAEVDLEEAAAYHRALPRHKQLGWVMRQAAAEGRCLTQPRGGFGTFELQLELMQTLDRDGLADIVPTTTDSYTRNEQWNNAQKGIEESARAGRSLLNGYPMVNYGVTTSRRLIESIDKPAIVLSGTAMPRLTCEIGIAAGYSGYLGSGIAYTTSYTKETTIDEGIRNYQYLDRLVSLYQQHGVELHRRQPGFLTGTNIPPSIAIMTCVLDVLLAAHQGVKNYGLELGQCMHLVQDTAAVQACGELCQEYLHRSGFHDVFTPVTSLHWMGAWPQDEAQSAALITYGGILAAVSGAVSVTTKSTHEAFGIPTPTVNAEGLRMTRMGIYLAYNFKIEQMEEYHREKSMIGQSVRAVIDRVLELGDGDVAVGTVRAFEAGVMDIPWSPNRQVASRVLPARDTDGYIRIFDAGAMPIPKEVLDYDVDCLRRRAAFERRPFDEELAVTSVYELSEPLKILMPFPWPAA